MAGPFVAEGSSRDFPGPVSTERMDYARREFARSLPSRLRRLKEALGKGDFEQAHGVLHQLAGTAGTLGYMPLSHAAAKVLRRIKKKSGPSDPELLHPLEELIHKISETVDMR